MRPENVLVENDTRCVSVQRQNGILFSGSQEPTLSQNKVWISHYGALSSWFCCPCSNLISMPNIIIDDQDRSHVAYKGSWRATGSPPEYLGTVTYSRHAGDSFVVTFYGTFIHQNTLEIPEKPLGDSIAVYGTIDDSSAGVQSSYSVDGASATTATARAGDGDTWRQLFWKSSSLPLSQQ